MGTRRAIVDGRGSGARHRNGRPSSRKPSRYLENNNNYALETDKVDSNCRSLPDWIICYSCVGLAAVLCYWNNLHGDLVHDDVKAIKTNPDVIGQTSVRELFQNDFWGRPMSHPSSHKSYRPLCILTFRLNYLLGRLDPSGYHIVNNLLHCVATVLFTALCKNFVFLGHQLTPTYLSGLLFATHPIHTEAVTGLVGRAELLSCVFFQLVLVLYLRTCQDRWRGRHAGLTGVLAVLALLSKEQGITVLGVCLLWELFTAWQNLRLKSGKSQTFEADSSFHEHAFRITSIVVLMTCLLLFRVWMLNGRLPQFQEEDNPASFSTSELTRVLTYVYLWSFNVWLVLCPVTLSHDWQMGSVPLVTTVWDPRNLASVLLVLAASAVVRVAISHKQVQVRQGVFLALMLTTVPFLPASNIFLRVGFVIAERVLYIPSMGIIIMVVYGAESIRQRLPVICKTNYVKWLMLALITLCGMRTITRNYDWHNRETLARAGLAALPGNAKMHYNYANVLADKGDTATSIQHYRQALRLWPDYASAHNNLATHLTKTSESLWHLSEAIKLQPCHTNAYTNLANIHSSIQNDKRSAVDALERAVACGDGNPRPHLALGALYQEQGLIQLAREHYRTAAQLAPWQHEVLHNVGVFYETQGEYMLALGYLLKASSIVPDSHLTLRTLGRIYRTLGDNEQADEHFIRALAISTDAVTLEAAAQSFSHSDRPHKSMELFREAYRVAPTERNILNLARSLTSLDLFHEAENLLTNHLSEFPENPRLIMQLANVYGLKKDHIQATKLLEEWMAKNEKSLDEKEKADFYHHLGNNLKDMNQLEKSVDYYLEVINLDPDNVDCHHNLAVYYHKLGYEEKAQLHYEAAILLDPDDRLLNSNFNRFLMSRQSADRSTFADSSLTSDQQTHKDAMHQDARHVSESFVNDSLAMSEANDPERQTAETSGVHAHNVIWIQNTRILEEFMFSRAVNPGSSHQHSIIPRGKT